jgi:bacillolysin
MRLVRHLQLAGLTYERYQQFYRKAQVFGGQVTLYKDSSGTTTTVIGAHYPDIVASNSVAISADQAQQTAERELGAGGDRIVQLLINPATGRYFYRVETRRLDSRWVHWINAATGRVINRFNALADNHGAGVKGDTKDVNGPDDASTDDDLTTFHGSSGHGARSAHWDLFSKDNRQITYDAKNRTSRLYYVTDSDNHWTTVTSNRRSPGHPALIDAQFYANTTDDYFQGSFGFNWTSGCGYTAMQSVAHYSRNYNTAFWNGTYTVYGDGDGTIFRELSGGLDVVSHEHTHGVTDCTSNLIYQDESGALNEAFSDMLGNSAEFFASEPATSQCVRNLGQTACADWWIGEDVYLPSDTVVGFRNMADPREDDDPDHYSERQIGGSDNGGVHTNSGIPNHAFYLLVNGGQNAGCDAVGSNGHTHTGDCDVLVVPIGLADSQKIFFQGFTSLPNTATMCQARKATEAVAASLFGSGSLQQGSTTAAWDAVGVPTSC